VIWSVYQHWDPLRVCVVGRSYPPAFYSWIINSKVRNLFERIAIETEEDYQSIIKKLEQFDVEVLRPDLPEHTLLNNKHIPPPMTPRDYSIMIGSTFYCNLPLYDFGHFYWNIKKDNWPDCNTVADMNLLPVGIRNKCKILHDQYAIKHNNSYNHIVDRIQQQGNTVKTYFYPDCNGAMVSRIGRDLYFGTSSYTQDPTDLKNVVNKEFTQTRNHIVNTGGHSDGTYCPVCPGLIISLHDIPTYADTFPDWEVVYLPGQSWSAVKEFLQLKEKNGGRWWIPGFEHDQDVVDTVEQWLGHWTGYVEETVFDVNMLIIDPKNVMVFNYNRLVFDALERYGITPHVVPFRHRYFWDGGIHCITTDLHREGVMQDYFSERS
jgi:hypothetical protein